MRGVRPRIRVGAAFQARVAPAPAPAPAAETTRGLVFDPHGIDPAALAAYLAAARGTEEAALARLHASGYDAAQALALGGARRATACRDRDCARPRSAVEWRRMLARLNARRDAHDEPVAVGDAVLLRSRARLPHVGLVERV